MWETLRPLFLVPDAMACCPPQVWAFVNNTRSPPQVLAVRACAPEALPVNITMCPFSPFISATCAHGPPCCALFPRPHLIYSRRATRQSSPARKRSEPLAPRSRAGHRTLVDTAPRPPYHRHPSSPPPPRIPCQPLQYAVAVPDRAKAIAWWRPLTGRACPSCHRLIGGRSLPAPAAPSICVPPAAATGAADPRCPRATRHAAGGGGDRVTAPAAFRQRGAAILSPRSAAEPGPPATLCRRVRVPRRVADENTRG